MVSGTKKQTILALESRKKETFGDENSVLDPLKLEAIIFDFMIYGGGNSDDEADDKSQFWLPFRKLPKDVSCRMRSMNQFIRN